MPTLPLPNLFELSPALALATLVASVALLVLPLFACPASTTSPWPSTQPQTGDPDHEHDLVQ